MEKSEISAIFSNIWYVTCSPHRACQIMNLDCR